MGPSWLPWEAKTNAVRPVLPAPNHWLVRWLLGIALHQDCNKPRTCDERLLFACSLCLLQQLKRINSAQCTGTVLEKCTVVPYAVSAPRPTHHRKRKCCTNSPTSKIWPKMHSVSGASGCYSISPKSLTRTTTP